MRTRLNHAGFGLAERRRSRTYQPMGYIGLPVLKTGRRDQTEPELQPAPSPVARSSVWEATSLLKKDKPCTGR